VTRPATQTIRPSIANLPAELGALPLGAGTLTDALPALPLELRDGVMGPIGPPDPLPIVGREAEGSGRETVPGPLGAVRETEADEIGETVGIGSETTEEPLPKESVEHRACLGRRGRHTFRPSWMKWARR
jgi:hypothetical protein